LKEEGQRILGVNSRVYAINDITLQHGGHDFGKPDGHTSSHTDGASLDLYHPAAQTVQLDWTAVTGSAFHDKTLNGLIRQAEGSEPEARDEAKRRLSAWVLESRRVIEALLARDSGVHRVIYLRMGSRTKNLLIRGRSLDLELGVGGWAHFDRNLPDFNRNGIRNRLWHDNRPGGRVHHSHMHVDLLDRDVGERWADIVQAQDGDSLDGEWD
jgi:hypothetical protein